MDREASGDKAQTRAAVKGSESLQPLAEGTDPRRENTQAPGSPITVASAPPRSPEKSCA